MKKWFLSHRKIVTIAIIAVGILIMLIPAMLYKTCSKSDFELVEILYYTSQIVSAIFVISGFVIAIWQYYLSCVDSKRTMDIIRVQKAVDLSEYYKDYILSYKAPIEYIFTNSGISEIISKIDSSQMEYFDEKELHTFLTDEDIYSLKNIQKSHEFFTAVINANSIYNIGLSDELIELYKQKCNGEYNLSDLDAKILSTFLGKLITKVLNNMEFFSLHFTHNVADESVVYKSLHQTYIDIVKTLYYNIAKINPLSTTKYFTNIIELYKLWNDRAINDETTFTDGVRNLTNKGTVVDSK